MSETVLRFGRFSNLNFSHFLDYRNGNEWWRLRSEFQKGLSSPHHIRKFLSDSDGITREFVTHIRPTNNASVDEVPDILHELSRLNLECECIAWTIY